MEVLTQAISKSVSHISPYTALKEAKQFRQLTLHLVQYISMFKNAIEYV